MNEKEKQIMLMAAIIAANKSGYKEIIAADAIALSKEIYKQVMGKK